MASERSTTTTTDRLNAIVAAADEYWKQNKRHLWVGVIFCPTAYQVVDFFLPLKVLGLRLPFHAEFHEDVDFYGLDPCQLPTHESGAERFSFFFLLRSTEENVRRTPGGYWEAIEHGEAPIEHRETRSIIGFKKSFVFYEEQVPHPRRTRWKMEEYWLSQDRSEFKNSTDPKMNNWIACKVYRKAMEEDLKNYWKDMYMTHYTPH